MNNAVPWILTIAAVALCVMLFMERDAELYDVRQRSAEREDSVLRIALRWQDSASIYMARADTLAALLDSARTTQAPPERVVAKWIRATKYAPLDTAVKILDTP